MSGVAEFRPYTAGGSRLALTPIRFAGASDGSTALSTIATLDGPLQDDAVLALGKIGDKQALPTLAALQRTAPRQTQPTIAAAIPAP